MKLIFLFIIFYSVQANEVVYVKNFQGTKLYRTPHFKSKILAQAKYGTPLDLTGVQGPIDSIESNSGQWFEIIFETKKGWAFSTSFTSDANLVTENGGVILEILDKSFYKLTLVENELVIHRKCEMKIPQLKFYREDKILKLEEVDGININKYEIFNVKTGSGLQLTLKKTDGSKISASLKIIQNSELVFELNGIKSQYISESIMKNYKTREENCDKNKSD